MFAPTCTVVCFSVMQKCTDVCLHSSATVIQCPRDVMVVGVFSTVAGGRVRLIADRETGRNNGRE